MNFGPGFGEVSEVVSTLHNLEQEVSDLADTALASSTVQVHVDAIETFDNTLPDELRYYLAQKGSEANRAQCIDLSLQYDRSRTMFAPTYAAITLDNQAIIEFAASRRMIEIGRFYMQVVTSEGKQFFMQTPGDNIRTQLPLFSVDELNAILKSVGLILPSHKQSATWGEVAAIFDFARKWKAISECSNILTPSEQLIVRDVVEGGVADSDETQSYTADSAWQRTVTLGFDTLDPESLAPYSSLQLTLTTTSELEVPHYQSISRVPIANKIQSVDDLLIPEFVEETILQRTEQNTERHFINPTIDLLKFLREAVLRARLGM